MQEGSPNSSYVGPIVEVAKALMVRRQANEVAHRLTRIALLCDNFLSRLNFEEPPDLIADPVFERLVGSLLLQLLADYV